MDVQSATPSTSITAADVLDGNMGSAPQIAPQPPEKEAPKAEEKISPKFQALIRRERQALELERAAKAREEDFNRRVKEFEAREARVKEFESIKQSNPRKALDLLGLSYQQLTEIELADGEIPADLQVKRVEDKFDNYLRGQEELERRNQEDAARRAEEEERQAESSFKTEISEYIKQNSDRYELISFEQTEDLVYSIIDEHYRRTTDPETGVGKVMTIAEAADKVEQHLEQKYDKARSLNKVKAFMEGRPEKDVPKPQNPNPSREQKTLNNHLSATPTPPRSTPITDEERVRRAIAYAKSLKT